MLAAEEHEASGKECGIAGQADPRGPRTFGMAEAVDAVLQPVPGDIAVNQRIAGYMRESKVKEKPQDKRGQRDQQEVLPILPEHVAE